MTCLPTTRDGYLAAIVRCIWYDRIEPNTIKMAAANTGKNPFAEPAVKGVRPTVDSALAAIKARVAAKNVQNAA